MKKFCQAVLCLALMLSFVSPCCAEENTLVIAILDEYQAMNLSTEEAFFASHPDAKIEYRIISQDKLSAALLSGAYDFDLTILPYQNALNMAKKGYFASVSEQLEIDGYPDNLLDVSSLLTWEDDIFGLPLSISQTFMSWNNAVAEMANIEYPDMSSWSWEEFYELQENFPIDSDNDGSQDVFLMYGSMLAAYPAFSNCNLDMFTQYASLYDDFSYFSEHLLSIFRNIVVSPATLGQAEEREGKSVLLSQFGLGNPIDLIDRAIGFEDAIERFLPMPLLDTEDEKYYGSMDVLGMMKDARNPELAKDFLLAYVSDTALDYATAPNFDRLVSKKLPTYLYVAEGESYRPKFSAEGDTTHCLVTAGRVLPSISFTYSEEAFNQSQAYREKLGCDTLLLGKDFYDAAWSYLQDWYMGRIDDRALTNEMSYLFDLAKGQR